MTIDDNTPANFLVINCFCGFLIHKECTKLCHAHFIFEPWEWDASCKLGWYVAYSSLFSASITYSSLNSMQYCKFMSRSKHGTRASMGQWVKPYMLLLLFCMERHRIVNQCVHIGSRSGSHTQDIIRHACGYLIRLLF